MSNRITVVAIFEPKAERTEQFLELMAPMVEGSREEQGCLLYDLYEEDGQGRYVLLEEYVDQEALEAHRGTDHYTTYRASSGDILERPVEVHVLRPLELGD
jgi:quinol monooxygenase YgiN